MNSRKILVLLAAAAVLAGTAAAPALAAPANNRAASQVNRTLGQLSAQRDTQLRGQRRHAQTVRQQRLREQSRPGDPQNRVQDQNENLRDRLDTLQDKLADQQAQQNAAQK